MLLIHIGMIGDQYDMVAFVSLYSFVSRWSRTVFRWEGGQRSRSRGPPTPAKRIGGERRSSSSEWGSSSSRMDSALREHSSPRRSSVKGERLVQTSAAFIITRAVIGMDRAGVTVVTMYNVTTLGGVLRSLFYPSEWISGRRWRRGIFGH